MNVLRLPKIKTFTNLIRYAETNLDKTCIIQGTKNFTYRQLLAGVQNVSQQLKGDKELLKEQRIAYLMPNSIDYVISQYATWATGSAAVPLCITHPINELEYQITHSESTQVLYHPIYEDKIQRLKSLIKTSFVKLEKINLNKEVDYEWFDFSNDNDALFIYTSGTTGKPKGVVLGHRNLEAQMDNLTEAWNYNNKDHILHCLPLHHVHGVVNALNCVLYNGGIVEFIKYNPIDLWQQFVNNTKINVFMAVPTIYASLIHTYDKLAEEEKGKAKANFKNFKLMVSGSSSLPSTVFDQWRNLSSHYLLERYGMSEIGMGLTNPFKPEEKRYKGHVGHPFPSVEVRLMNEDRKIINEANKEGEIQIKGPSVFKYYWKNPTATAECFTDDGWFQTGDIAQLTPDKGYQILGRKNVDIIKYKGFKISALEIEKEILDYDNVLECAVFGVPDTKNGENIVALVKVKDKANYKDSDLIEFLKSKLASYKIPNKIYLVDEIAKNAMGKVNKKVLKQSYLV